MSILPMYIQGASASKVNDYTGIKDLILTKDMLLACTTKELFKETLYTQWGEYIAEDRIDECTFDYSETYGCSLRLGTNINSLEEYPYIFVSKTVPIPKSFYISYYYAGGSTRMCVFSIYTNTQSNGYRSIFSINDGNYNNDSGHRVTVTINNNSTSLYTYGGNGAFANNHTVTIPDQVPNCVSSTDTECTINFFNALTHSNTYVTAPLYITELRISF